MIRKKNKGGGGAGTVAINTLIGEHAKLEGNISSNGSIKIDGEINGEIKCNNEIVVDEIAHITGNLTAQSVYVAGTIVGNITATAQVSVSSTARIKGDVFAGSLVIDEGAEMTGTCQVCDNSDTA